MPLDAYMYTGLRSPFGRHAGALAKLRPDDMLAEVIAKVVAESGFAPEKIEDVVVGCANQAGEDSRCVARHAALVAGLPIEIPGSVLQRNCGSRSQRDRDGGAGDHLRRGRRVRRRRRREHEPRPVRDGQGRDAVQPRRQGVRLDDRRALPEPEGRGPLRRRHDARDRRQSGARLPDHARGGRHLRRGLAEQIRRRQGRRVLRRRDHLGRGAGRPRRAGHGGGGRAPAPAAPTWRRSPNCGRCSRTA